MHYIKWLEMELQKNGIIYAPSRDAQGNEILIGDYSNVEYLTRWKWSLIRAERERLLVATDYAMLPDAPPYTQQEVDEIAAYRQALRDIPQTYSTPDSVAYPEKPSWL